MTVIGVIAEKGAGKSLFVKLTKKLAPHLRVVSVRFSDPLRDILGILGKEESRESLQTLATALRTAFQDEGILNSALKKRTEGLNADIIFLDGVRKPEEAEFVKSLGGILVYIRADQKTRFERRRNDPENTDEGNMGWEQFLRQDAAPPEIATRTVGETLAHHCIDNNGGLGRFEKQIRDFLEKYVVPRLV